MQKTKGQGKISIPKYFKELHEILGEKHKVTPAKVIDSASENVNKNYQICKALDFGDPLASTSKCNRVENIYRLLIKSQKQTLMQYRNL